MDTHQTSPFDQSPQVFRGIRFFLLGFNPINKSQVSRKLISSGGIDAGSYEDCTHVIVDKIAYDDPVCVAARNDGKILVSGLWVEHSFEVGAPVDPSSVMYRPAKDLNGIPGAKSLVICLTGYQRDDREDIMTMVDQMGAQFSKPLIANKVTHLICYKFEGEKYLLAKKMKRIKLINHKWLEDCLRNWEIVSEVDYNKSGYELEMEAEAKDSEEEPEGRSTRHNDGILASPHRSLLSRQEVTKTVSNTSASKGLFSNVENTVSLTMKSPSDKFPNPHEAKSLTKNAISAVSEPSNLFQRTVGDSVAQNNFISASIVTNKSPQNETRNVVFANSDRQMPMRTTPSTVDTKNNTGSAKRLNKFNFSAAFNMSNSLVEKESDNGPAFYLEEEQYGSPSGKRKMDNSCGSTKLQKGTHYEDASNKKSPYVESAFHDMKKDRPYENSNFLSPGTFVSPAQNPTAKGTNVYSDMPIFKISTSEIAEDEEIQQMENLIKGSEKPSSAALSSDLQKSSTLNMENEEIQKMENLIKGFEKSSSAALSSDLQKSSTSNMEINEQSGGSNPNPVKTKSIGKKFSAPNQNLDKMKTVSQKGSIFFKNSDSGNDATASTVEVVPSVNDGLQIDNVCMDDETEPPEEANKEKHKYGELEKTFDIVMEEKAEGDLILDVDQNIDKDGSMPIKNKAVVDKSDENVTILSDNISRGKSKKGKKKSVLSVKEVTENKAAKKKELLIEDHNKKLDIQEEALPSAAGKTKINVNDLEKSVEVKKAEGACNDPENNVPVDIFDFTENLVSDMTSGVNTKKGKKRTALTVNKVNNKKASRKKEPVIDGNNEISEIREKATSNRSGKIKENLNDLEKSLEMKTAEGKKKTVFSVKEVTEKKAAKKKELLIEDNNKKLDIQQEVFPRTAEKTKINVNDLEKSVEVKKAECVFNDSENNVSVDIFDFTENLVSDITSGVKTKKGKKRTALSVKEVNNKKASRKNEPVIDGNNEKSEIREEATSTRAGKIKKNLNDLEMSMEIKRAEGVCSDPEQKNGETDADVDTVNVPKKKETKKNKRPLSKTKKDCIDSKVVDNKEKRTSRREVKACDMEAQKENMQVPVDDQTTCNKQVVKKITPKSVKPDSTDAVKAEPMCFILTGHTLQRKEFQQIIRRLKGKVCRVAHQWSYQATHFIVPDPVRRTEKFFAAAASGRWILKTDYLSASNEAGRFLAEEPYEWHKNGLSEDGQVSLEAPRKWRLLKEKTGHGAFYGMRIIIYGECIAPSLDTLKRVIKAADGTILATSPPYTRFLNTNIDFAIVSPGMPHVDIWVQEFLKHEIPCISADYLVEYVCKPGYPLENHIQFDTNVWAERSYNKLKSQLEEEVSEPGTPDSNDVACEICGFRDRGEEMLICGDESGSIGCGAGAHIDCCDPPLDSVPEEDWFCSKCHKAKNSKTTKRSSKRKGK